MEDFSGHSYYNGQKMHMDLFYISLSIFYNACLHFISIIMLRFGLVIAVFFSILSNLHRTLYNIFQSRIHKEKYHI